MYTYSCIVTKLRETHRLSNWNFLVWSVKGEIPQTMKTSHHNPTIFFLFFSMMFYILLNFQVISLQKRDHFKNESRLYKKHSLKITELFYNIIVYINSSRHITEKSVIRQGDKRNGGNNCIFIELLFYFVISLGIQY